MIDQETKACPFCGGPAEVRPREDYYDFRVFCKDDKCGCSSPKGGRTFEEAQEWWNRRAGDRQPLMPEVEGVKALASATGSDARPPKRIWLQWDGDATEGSPLPMEKRGEVTWCGDKIFKRDVMYIRSDCVKRQNV